MLCGAPRGSRWIDTRKARPSRAQGARARHRSLRLSGQFVVGVPVPKRGSDKRNLPCRLSHDDLTLELAPVLVEIGFLRDAHHDGLTGDCPIRTCRPADNYARERSVLGLQHRSLKMFIGPASSEWTPFLLCDVREPIFLEPRDSPIAGSLVIRRSGKTGTIHIREVEHMVHHLRVLEGFRLDAMNHCEIDVFGGEDQQWKRYKDAEGKAAITALQHSNYRRA